MLAYYVFYYNEMNITKTYFWINKDSGNAVGSNSAGGSNNNYTFPPEFIASKNKKFIVVEECKATLNDKLVGDVILHADFIHRDHYLNYACCFVNEEANRDTAKYEYNSTRKDFNIWFTDLNNNNVEVSAFALRMLLIY